MNKVMALPQEQEHSPLNRGFDRKQIEVLRNSICKDATPEEFEVFLMACNKTQLDPFMRQIYAVPRKVKNSEGAYIKTMTIQTGIDGYRLIAERTGLYAPGPEPTYSYDDQKNLVSATAYIKKQTRDGTWHTISASAYVDEYMQTYTDKYTKEQKPSGMWATMPRTMLAKCAEAQALRRAFPAEMSGVYTKEEMQQADIEDITPRISLEQASYLEKLFSQCEPEYKQIALDYLKAKFSVDGLYCLPQDLFERVKYGALKNIEELEAKQTLVEDQSNV